MLLFVEKYDTVSWETGEPGGLPSDYRRGLPSRRKKGGDADDSCRILSVLFGRYRPCWSVLSDFQGRKIAATTAIVTADPVKGLACNY